MDEDSASGGAGITGGAGEATVIRIDPAASDGVSLEAAPPESAPASTVNPELEQDGPVAQAIESAIPETGVAAVDRAADTLGDSVGSMVDTAVAYAPQVVIAVLVLLFTGLLVGVLTTLLHRVLSRSRVKSNLRDLAVMAARVGVWFVGFMAAAAIVFPGFGIGNLLATAGLASVAIGLAFQDIFENAFAGVLILWRFPFKEGDWIELPGEDLVGRVEEIEIRMTHLRKTTGELVLVPNATIYKQTVSVLTNRDTRRLTVMCGIAYGEDVATGRRVIREAVQGCDSVRRDQDGQAVEVYAQAFGASSIDFEVTWWTGPTPRDQRRSRDQVVEAVKQALDDAGIEIPYPYRTLTFSQNEPDILDAVRGRAKSSDADGSATSGPPVGS